MLFNLTISFIQAQIIVPWNFFQFFSACQKIKKLFFHLSQIPFEYLVPVSLHGLAALLSFSNVLRAASLFNERRTFTLLFVLVSTTVSHVKFESIHLFYLLYYQVGFPFLLFTVLARIVALAVVVCFMDPWWTVVLILG